MMSRQLAKINLLKFSRQKPPSGLHASLRRGLHTVDYTRLQTKQPVFQDRSDRKYVFVGVGSIGRPTVHMLDEFVGVNYQNVLLVDQIDHRSEPSLQKVFERGAKFIHKRLEDEDWEPFFKSLDLKPYDVIVDLTTDTNSAIVVKTARQMSLHYVNTAQESNSHFVSDDIYENSLFFRRHQLDEIHKTVADPKEATQIYDFGMNPGVISHFALQGLLDVANHVLAARKDPQLAEYVARRQFNLIAKHLNLHTIHSSEVDTQIAQNHKPDGTFINTWSVIGLLEEGCEPAQAGWGSHERYLPEDGIILGREGVGFKTMGYKKLHWSWVPDEEFVGMIIPHGEALTLNRFLRASNYSPTVHYVYRLPLQTKKLMESMTLEELTSVKKWRVLNPFQDDLVGEDKVGTLLIFPQNPITGANQPWTYWYGSVLGQGTSKFFGPTSIQVVAGTLTALKYAVQNGRLGPMYPEKVDHDFVMHHTLPYMGRVVSTETEWRPKSTQFTDMSLPDTGIA